MPLSMRIKKEVAGELRKRYQKARKKEKVKILDEFCHLTGYNRFYAARTLRGTDNTDKRKFHKRCRARIYSEEVLIPLKKIWAVLDGISGKRLKPFIREIIISLEQHGELKLDKEVK